MIRAEINLGSKKNKEVLDITNFVNQKLKELEVKDGLCHLFALHTTCALSVADLDPGTDLDMLDAFANLVPKHTNSAPSPSDSGNTNAPTRINYRHPHNPKHVPDHILSAMIKPEIMFPIQNGELILGSWQRVVFFEFDGPRERKIILTISN